MSVINRLSLADVGRLMKRLHVAYGKPHGLTEDEVISEWHRSMKNLPADAVHAAFDWLIDGWESNYRPKPADVHRRVREQLSEQARPTAVAHHDDRCRSCQCEHWPAGFTMPSGHVVGRLRCKCPPAPSWRWYTEDALAYVDSKHRPPREFDALANDQPTSATRSAARAWDERRLAA